VLGLAPGTAEISATYLGHVGTHRITLLDPGLTAHERDYLEALVLGSGPLSPSDGRSFCVYPQHWTGFPRGTHVRLTMSLTLPVTVRAALQAELSRLPEITSGGIFVTAETTSEPNPQPAVNQVTVTALAAPTSHGCGSDDGCTFPTFMSLGVLTSSRVVLPPSQTLNAFVHDVVGHGLLGLCHVDGHAIGGPDRSLMSGGPAVFADQIAATLTAQDIAAIRRTYSTPLQPGAYKTAFLDLGIINPSPGVSAWSGLTRSSRARPIGSVPMRGRRRN
jgi:hypothetical protein